MSNNAILWKAPTIVVLILSPKKNNNVALQVAKFVFIKFVKRMKTRRGVLGET